VARPVSAELRAAVVPRVRAVPAWAWVTAIVVCSAALRYQLSKRVAAPWIMVDELIYSELAKSFAASGRFLVRGEANFGVGLVYPALIAPAWRLFTAVPDAYQAAKTINSVLMSLAAVPAYLLARRVVTVSWALVAAVLAVAVPGLLYTGMLMTENAFYPAFLLFLWALCRMLERPTTGSQLLVPALFGLAFLVRTQAVALLPAALLAPVVLDRVERRPWRRLRRFGVLYGTVAAGALLLVAAQLARGRSVDEVLGAYRAAIDTHYTVRGVARWVLYHFAGLDLASGVVPFLALLLLVTVVRRLEHAARVFVVATVCVGVLLVVEVGAFASQPSVVRIEERNLFYLLAPLCIALVLWLHAGAPRPRPAVLLAAAVAGLLPAVIPYGTLIGPPAVSDTFSLLPWWWLGDHLLDAGELRWAPVLAAAVAAAATVVLPRRLLPALPAAVAVYFVAVAAVALNGYHGIHNAAVGTLWAGIKTDHPDWVDRAVGPNEDVAAIWTGNTSAYAIWMNEIFNRSVGAVRTLQGPLPGGLPETPIEIDRTDGVARFADGRPFRARYVLVDGSLTPDGVVVAQDEKEGMSVVRVDGDVRTSTLVDGLYPSDTWSGRQVVYHRLRCSGGRLVVSVGSDPSLFTTPQTITARVAGKVVDRETIRPDGNGWVVVPLRRGRDGSCVAVFTVSPTAVPAKVVPGSADDRVLGAHFVGFDYRP
jgi:hypothetical protein